MTTYRRSGHWRRGRYGDLHWVSEHDVTREDWSSGWPYAPIHAARGITPTTRATTVTSSPHGSVDPNARCPICGAAVFFYSNGFGSRVYFDALGPPWPKHPCMDDTADRPGVVGRVSVGMVWTPTPGSTTKDLSRAPEQSAEVFTVESVTKRGAKRIVLMREVSGEDVEVVTSPPPPPVGAIAIVVSAKLHWFDPETSKHGKNDVWERRVVRDQ